MFKFNASKLKVEYVYLKSCTMALGGSIRIVDDTSSKEVYKKIDAPMAVVRGFQQLHKVSQYFEPILTAIVSYEGFIVAMERSDNTDDWVPHCISNINSFIKPVCSNVEWYIDGTFIYHFKSGVNAQVNSGEFLTSDGTFRSVDTNVIQLSHLSRNDVINITERTCIAFLLSNGTYKLTPPIWKSLSNMGSSSLIDVEETYRFDDIDSYLSLNLLFALNASKDIGDVFGFEEIEPIQLPELMIQLNTVNLPKVHKSRKSTFDIGMQFTHVVAWLIGLINRTDNLSDFIKIRRTLKVLTTKGIFFKSSMEDKSIFKEDNSVDTVPFVEYNDAIVNVKSIPDHMIINGLSTKVKDSSDGVIGGLYGAE